MKYLHIKCWDLLQSASAERTKRKSRMLTIAEAEQGAHRYSYIVLTAFGCICKIFIILNLISHLHLHPPRVRVGKNNLKRGGDKLQTLAGLIPAFSWCH